jgi:hypothetical protein
VQGAGVRTSGLRESSSGSSASIWSRMSVTAPDRRRTHTRAPQGRRERRQQRRGVRGHARRGQRGAGAVVTSIALTALAPLQVVGGIRHPQGRQEGDSRFELPAVAVTPATDSHRVTVRVSRSPCEMKLLCVMLGKPIGGRKSSPGCPLPQG